MDRELINLLILLVFVVIWVGKWILRRRAPRPEKSQKPEQAPTPSPIPIPGRQAPRPEPRRALPPAVGAPPASPHQELMSGIREVEEAATRLIARLKRAGGHPLLEEALERHIRGQARQLSIHPTHGAELERIRRAQKELFALHGRLAALGVLTAQREQSPAELHISDQTAQSIFAAVMPERIGSSTAAPIIAVLAPMDEDLQSTLSGMGLRSMIFVSGWTGRIETWPETIHRLVQSALSLVPGLRAEIFKRFGLSPQWPVPYSEPIYVTPAEILGPFGAWLDCFLADVISGYICGPVWTEAMVNQIQKQYPGDAAKKSPTSRSGYYLGAAPAPLLRSLLLFDSTVRAGHGEAAGQMRAAWEKTHGQTQDLWMPTRRGSFYGVPVQPYLEAGMSLMEVLHTEPFAALGGRPFTKLPGLSLDEISDTLLSMGVSVIRTGQRIRGSIRYRLATGLRAFLGGGLDPALIARSVFSGLARQKPGRDEAASFAGPIRDLGSGLVDLSPNALVEALILGAALGQSCASSRFSPIRRSLAPNVVPQSAPRWDTRR